MKTTHCRFLCQAVLLSALSATFTCAAPPPAQASQQAIPFDQLGTEAQKKYSGDGISITPTADGARLRAVFQKLEGHATREGLWLTSTADEDGGKAARFRVLATGIGRGDANNSTGLPTAGIVHTTTGLAAFLRPGVVEEYRVSLDGVRQDFIVMERPAGDGLLSVMLDVTGATAEAAANGVKLTLNGSGRAIAYARLRVTDATGRELSASLDVLSPNRLAVRADDTAAIYPVRIDPTFSDADWVSLGRIRAVNGGVSAIAVDSINGRIYMGGNFTTVGGASASNIAVWNGTTWAAVGSGMGGAFSSVTALVMSGSNLYAGGSFTTAGGVTANSIAKWNGSAWSALGTGMNDQVSALAVIGSDLYAGGFFTAAGGTPANYIAKWNGSAWSALGSGMTGSVSALAVSGSLLYAGGWFTVAGGVATNSIAKWNGSAWSALGTGMGGEFPSVRALAVIGSNLYAGGSFTTAGGGVANYLAKWNGSAWSALGSGMDGEYPSVSALAVSGTDLYVGGNFTTAGGVPASSIAKWNGSAWSALGSGMDGYSVDALVVSGSDLYVGGAFLTAGGMSANSIAKWNGSAWSSLESGINDNIWALAVIGSDLYAGGWFTTAGTVSASAIAKWNGSAWSALGSGMGGEYPSVYALAVSGSNLYAAGSFTTAGGVAANSIAKWNGSAWSALGTGMNDGVSALAVIGSDLYAGGSFTTAGGVTANQIAKWNGSAWSALGLGTNGYVGALAVSGSVLYAGGSFTTAGGVTTNRIAKWNGSAWSALGSGMTGSVSALAVNGSVLYAGGSFTTAGGVTANSIAKWNGSAWSALGSGMTGYGVYALAVRGSDLYAGGNFTTAGGVSANNIAKWNGSAWSALGSGMNNSVFALTSDGVGHLFLGGAFTTAGSTISGYAAQANVGSIALPSSLTIQGPASVGASGTASYACMATYADNSTSDVTSQVAWSVGGGPGGTHMTGSTLFAGSGSASTATITANLTTNGGSRTATKAVTIGTGLSVGLHTVAVTYASGSGNILNYHLQAAAIPSGGTGNVTVSWKLDNAPVGAGDALELDDILPASPGNHELKVILTDGAAPPAQATTVVLFPKSTQINEQYPKIGSNVPHQGTLFAADAVLGYTPDANRTSKGLVVIIHGMNSKVTTVPGPDGIDDWMKRMADAIAVNLPGAETPNIILYDWHQDADVTTSTSAVSATSLKAFSAEVMPANASFSKKLFAASTAVGAGAAVSAVGLSNGTITAVSLLALRPVAENHGFALADYIRAEILAGRVNPAAPIHLIGHSGGGFVASNCGLALLNDATLQSSAKMPTKLQVTTLDTPVIRFSQIAFIRDVGGKFERDVSSAIGEIVPGVVLVSSYDALESALNSVMRFFQSVVTYFAGSRPAPGFEEVVNYHSGQDEEATEISRHSHAHEWYIHTIQNPNSFMEGFYYSPFPGGHPFPAAASIATSGLAVDASGASAASPYIALSGFSSFGNVVESSGAYTLTEQGNAGIYQGVTLPMNVSTVKFRVQFTQAGDGDFIEVSFGDHLPLSVISDGPILRAGLVEFDLPVVAYGGETGQLLFKLNGVGADNAVVVIDNITITTADDADGDGLTFAQETTLGTDPRYSDSDADGLDDWAEVNTTLTNPLLPDSDGDGLSDAQEIIAGTNATNATSVFTTTGTARSPTGDFTITWAAKAGKTYRVQRSDTPHFADYTVVGDNIPGVEPTTSFTDNTVPAGTQRMFYRVEVQ